VINFKTGNFLNAIDIVKKEPIMMLSLFIKGLLNCYYHFPFMHVLSLQYVMHEFLLV
jgi:hypothetical protein